MNGNTVVGSVGAADVAAGGDRAEGCETGQHVGQRGAPDCVDRARPRRRLERLAQVGQLVSRDDLAGAEPAEEGLRVRLAAAGGDREPQAGEHRHRHAADAAGRPGDEHGARLRGDPVVEQHASTDSAAV